MIDKPYARCLGNNDNQQYQEQLHGDSGGKSCRETSDVVFPQFEGYKSGGSRTQRRIYEREHPDYAPYSLINTEIVYPQYLEDDSWRVKAYRHYKEHPEIQEDSVLGYSSFAYLLHLLSVIEL